MAQGTVKWFDDQKAYGWITSDSGSDVFVHRSGLVSKAEGLVQGDRVEFNEEEGQKGPKAVRVRVVEPNRSRREMGPARVAPSRIGAPG